MEKQKKVEYNIIRKMCDTQDAVRYYDKIDTFKDLKTARNYLKELIVALHTIPGPYGRNRLQAIEKCLHKFGLSNAYDTSGVENKIEKKIIIENSQIFKGV